MGPFKMAYKLAKSYWRRAGLFVFTAGWTILSIRFLNLSGQENQWFPYLWPLWFMMTSVLTFLFALRPKSEMLWRLSGAFGVTALASRPAGVFLRWIDGTLTSGWSILISIVIYSMSAMLLWWFWIREVGDWHHRHQHNLQIKGD